MMLLAVLLLMVPPLSEGQQSLVDSVRDGETDPVLIMLLDHIRSWPAELSPGDPELSPLPGSDQQDAPSSIGRAIMFKGRLEQRSTILVDGREVIELAVRDPDGLPVLVYTDPGMLPPEGRSVTIVGRTFGPVEALSNDGLVRTYPTVVGRVLATPVATSSNLFGLVVALATLLALIMFWLIRARVSRITDDHGSRRPQLAHGIASDDDSLPGDPAEALERLDHRHEPGAPGHETPRHSG